MDIVEISLIALFQLLLINIFFNQIDIDNQKFIWMPVGIYFLTQNFFKKMNDTLYYNSLNVFILSYGIYLFIDSIYAYIID